jgi:uncharacterized membrane protein YidH (DUF202 family)
MLILVILVALLAIVGGALIYRNNKKTIDKAEVKVRTIVDTLKK